MGSLAFICSSSCTKSGKCTKGFQEEVQIKSAFLRKVTKQNFDLIFVSHVSVLIYSLNISYL